MQEGCTGGGWELLSMGKAFAVHLAGQENPHGSTLEKGMMEQMATPLLSSLVLARQTMLQVWQDVQAGSRPSPRCSLPHFLLSLCLQLSPSSTPFSFPSSPILLLLPSFQFLLSLLTLSQRSFGYIHRLGEGKSTAAKEKTDISVSLRGLSRWLLQ